MQQQQQQPQAQVTTTTSFFENGVKSPTAPAPAPPLVVHTPLSPPEGFPRSVFGTGSPRSVFGSGSSSPNAGHSGPAFTTARRGAPRSSVGLTGRRPTTTDYVMLYRQSYTAQDLSKTQQGIVVPVPPVPISPAPLPPGLQQQQQQEQQPPQRSSQPPNASFSLSKTQSGVLSPERKVIITTKYQPMIRSKYQQQQQLQPQQKRQQYYYSQQNAQKTPLSQSPSVCLQESPKPLGSSPALDSKISVLEKHVNDQNEFIRKLQSENAALKETAERLRKANGKPVNAHACKSFESGRQLIAEKPNIKITSSAPGSLEIEIKVFFSRPFESAPKVNAWIISCDEVVRVPHKCIVPTNEFFTAKTSLCTKDTSGLSIHWTAFAEHESNEAFNTAMQSIMTLPNMTPADLMALVKKYESSNLLYLTDSSGQNLVHASAQAGNYELTKILIEKGVDFDLKDIHGWTPLITAVNAGNLDIANLLISKNASLTTITVRNGTLLHYLMKSPQTDENKDYFDSLLNTFLNCGIDINKEDDYNETPLTYFCGKGGSVDTIQKLLSHGADINKPGRRGLTPLQMCVIYDNVPFAEFLVSRGANPDLVFYNNKSAKEMVMSSKNPALRNLFMGEGEFTMLPENVTHKILSYLPPKDLVTVRLCSKKHKVIVDKILSDYGYMSKYGNLYEKYMVYNAAVEALNETLDNANQNMGEWLKPIKTRDFVSLVSVDSQNPAFFAEYKIQISVVGSTGYGKTSFISTIRDGVFPIDPVPDRTHCISLHRVSLGSTVNIILWDSWCKQFDTVPNPDVRQISSSDGILLAYDPTDSNVIQNIDLWKKRLSSISRPDVKILLVETKSDVKGTQRYINLRQISAITELWKSEEPTKSIAFMPVSSKKVQNVETALKWICDSVITDLKYSTPHH